MISVLVVADSGSVLADLTTAVRTVPGTYIARHGSGRKPLDQIVAALTPDLVVIGDLCSADHALRRLQEVRRSAPDAKVVLLSSHTEANWLADALRAEATAVLPGALEPNTLAGVLREVLAEPVHVAPPLTVVPTERGARPTVRPRRAARRRVRRISTPEEGTAA